MADDPVEVDGLGPLGSNWAIRVPASSANLGAGFDVLGMALGLHATIGTGPAPSPARVVDEHHPASNAYRLFGGGGEVWVHSPIPAARGLGFSGAMRVGGAAVAAVERDGFEALDDPVVAAEVLDVAVRLEGHADNAAASLHGGVVVVSGDRVASVPVNVDVVMLAWVPDSVTSSTDGSRAALPTDVSLSDAVFNIGRTALFVAALVNGDLDALRDATQDRLHQVRRLERLPDSADALTSALDAGAVAAWLSGSGPSVAVMCAPDQSDRIAAALPPSGHVKQLNIDAVGACVVGNRELPRTS